MEDDKTLRRLRHFFQVNDPSYNRLCPQVRMDRSQQRGQNRHSGKFFK